MDIEFNSIKEEIRKKVIKPNLEDMKVEDEDDK